eukprot:TRINITY_DN5621_c0_g6_i1.p1 TRINITY_DN5621_c0_g6~~TRINITY_DN5621_c0_g6_i1.p1  ORF type:complete len:1099 (+),score=366.81 TRINITY_DN5621_c0_g6_i1:411-3707(+)
MEEFSEWQFQELVDLALAKVRTILHTTRSPAVAADVPHKYDDKYGLAEFLTNTSLAAFINAFEVLGLTEEKLRQLLEWSKKRSVTIRFKADEKCTFDREEKRKVESSREYVTEYESSSGHKASITDKKITKITEYFWKVDFEWELFAFRGNKVDDKVVINSRKAQSEMKTTTKDNPRWEARSYDPLDINVTWLLQQINPETLQFKFAIDRTKAKTPRRNAEIESALTLDASFVAWVENVEHYLKYSQFPIKQENSLNMSSITPEKLFIPVVPFFETNASELKQIEAPSVSIPRQLSLPGIGDSAAKASSATSLKIPGKDSGDGSKSPRKDKEKDKEEPPKSPRGKDKDKKKDKKKDKEQEADAPKTPVSSEALVLAVTSAPSLVKPAEKSATATAVLSIGDVNVFLAEQKRSIIEKLAELDLQFPATGAVSIIEATVSVLVQHVAVIAVAHRECVNYIEKMLYDQLVSAIGKIVTPVDFTNYMRFHNRKLFRSAYEMMPFSYAVRRPDHTPEGTLSIESQLHDGSIAEPIYTTVRHIPAQAAGLMKFPISAATNITFRGDRYLHGWINHQFADNSGASFNLVARARQFSSFIMLVGRIASATVFEPKGAIIIQNKDELKIPLMMETIPTPKEFRDAIESMSPEQQRFCKAYRAMQLESTLFGVLIIQIKPQMEKLLNLADDSLTKEIRLTQDLQELFMKYQIPSDLLKFDGAAHVGSSGRIDAVKDSVRTMMQMLEEKKEAELIQAVDEYVYNEPIPSPPITRPTKPISRPTVILPTPEPSIDYEVDSVRKKPSTLSKLVSFFSGSKTSAKSPRRREAESSTISYSKSKSSAPMDYNEGISYQSETLSRPSAKMDLAPAPMMDLAPAMEMDYASSAASFDDMIALPEASMSMDISVPEPAAPAAAPADAKPAEPKAASNEPKSYDLKGVNAGGVEVGEDFTKVPGKLDAKFDKLDEDSALRPTIINPGTTWKLQYQKALLAEPESKSLADEEQKEQKNRAYDLLDALSRSGSLSIDCAELHVVIAATHCFTKSLVQTIVAENMNPIEKVERSTLIVASTIHNDAPAATLVKPEQLERVSTYSPKLFVEAASVPAVASK